MTWRTLPPYGDHLTMEQFKERCLSGALNDLDGFAEGASDKQIDDGSIIYPSEVRSPGFTTSYTHVVWFNN